MQALAITRATLQELLRRGVLGQSFVISAAHTDADVDHTVDAVAAALVEHGLGYALLDQFTAASAES